MVEVVAAEMPRYKSHKTVHALKIKSIETSYNDAHHRREVKFNFEDDGYAPIVEDAEICQRYQPKPGDYYVVYDDGYKSLSPAKAFEEGYTQI